MHTTGIYTSGNSAAQSGATGCPLRYLGCACGLEGAGSLLCAKRDNRISAGLSNGVRVFSRQVYSKCCVAGFNQVRWQPVSDKNNAGTNSHYRNLMQHHAGNGN